VSATGERLRDAVHAACARWSVKEVLGHLVDHLDFDGYDQDAICTV
jgi:hypothetical protein